MSALSWFDWRIAVALLGIIGATAALIAWQNRQHTEMAARWLGYSALGLELLGLALSVFWAVNAPSGSIMPVIFVGGWVAMLVGRAVLIPQAIAKHTGMAFDTAVYGGLLLAYVALYGSGLFHALNDSSDAADARLEASLPAQALDAEIVATRQRLANLAGFADSSKAHSEEQATAAAQAKSAGRINALRADLAAAKVKLAGCKHDHITRCITPARAEIASLESQLSGLGGSVSSNGYATRHAEYNGVSAHLVELQKQRAALSTSGQGVSQAWTADDRFVAWVFGITEEQANRIKWLIFTLIFDVLSLAFRVVSALLMEGNSTGAVKRKLIALIDAGVSPRQAVSMLDGEPVAMSMQPAGVKLPSLNTGGRIDADGLANLHAGEIVLNAAATAALDKLHPGLADSLNAGATQPAVNTQSAEKLAEQAREEAEYKAKRKEALEAAQQAIAAGKWVPVEKIWIRISFTCVYYGGKDRNRVRVLMPDLDNDKYLDIYDENGQAIVMWEWKELPSELEYTPVMDGWLLRAARVKPATSGLADKLNAQGNAFMPAQSMPIVNDLNKAMPKEGNDFKAMTTKGNDPAQAVQHKGLQLIRCASCGCEVMQRTVWQKFCASCGAERRRGVLLAKKASKA